MTVRTLPALVWDEWFLGATIATSVAFLVMGDALLSRLSSPAWLAAIFLWLFAAVLGSALSVVRHAEHLAVRLGEPYGTLILTLAITFIEVVSISAVMLHGENNPTLTRDTLFAVVMIILNGMVGLSLLLGAWRHREQHYNLQGANAYLGVIIPLVVLSLLLPDYTQTTPGPTLSVTQEGFLVLVAAPERAAQLRREPLRARSYVHRPTAPLCLLRSDAQPALEVAYRFVACVLYRFASQCLATLQATVKAGLKTFPTS